MGGFTVYAQEPKSVHTGSHVVHTFLFLTKINKSRRDKIGLSHFKSGRTKYDCHNILCPEDIMAASHIKFLSRNVLARTFYAMIGQGGLHLRVITNPAGCTYIILYLYNMPDINLLLLAIASNLQYYCLYFYKF